MRVTIEVTMNFYQVRFSVSIPTAKSLQKFYQLILISSSLPP
jgi:hypothetical protein